MCISLISGAEGHELNSNYEYNTRETNKVIYSNSQGKGDKPRMKTDREKGIEFFSAVI